MSYTKKNDKAANHIATHLGAGVGFVAFLLFGAVPGLLYGGYMGLIMSKMIYGDIADPTIATRIITGGGMLLGLVAAISLFLVVGSVLGSAVGFVVRAVTRAATADDKESVSAQA